MLVIALVVLGGLVVNFYPDIWQEISRKRVATLIGIVVALTVIIVLLAIGGATIRWTGFRGMTLRDWLPIVGALLVPVVVALGTGWITWQLAENENQRAEAEREIAEQRAQDEALQAYLSQMGGLLLERDLRTSEKGSEVRTLARARTLTVLGRLDQSRKTALMQFLVEADLVQRVDGRDPIIGLSGADLIYADLGDADLRGANLREARLHEAFLGRTDLSDADLSQAFLPGAYVSGTNLRDAVLFGTDLVYADLAYSDLIYAYLRYADLSDADLSDTEGITNEELQQQAASLEGATMPNGQKYEDWLKDREKRQQDE
jgi:uncharacterized protein YjbI with pentapeptide repeats